MPFVNLRLYTNIPFTMGCLIGFLNTMEFRGTSFLMPIMLQRIFHYTPFQAGLFFLPSALVMGVNLDRHRTAVGQNPASSVCSLWACWDLRTCRSSSAPSTPGPPARVLLVAGDACGEAAQAFCHSPLTCGHPAQHP